MKIARAMAAEIKRAVEARIGCRARCEVGERGNAATLNALLWSDDDDLIQTYPLHRIGDIEIRPVGAGVELDVYAFTRDGATGEEDLYDNVSVRVSDGQIVSVVTSGEEAFAALDADTDAEPDRYDRGLASRPPDDFER